MNLAWGREERGDVCTLWQLLGWTCDGILLFNFYFFVLEMITSQMIQN